MPRLIAVLGVALVVAGCSPASSVESSSPAPSAGSPQAPPSASLAPPSATGAPSDAPSRLAWEERRSTGGPSAREDHTWTVDGAGEVAYLFGGRDGPTVHGDLWAYDLSSDTWSEVRAGRGPAPRFGHEAVWVEDIGLVVFAGQAGPTFFNDLWAFDPDAGAWRALDAAGAVPTPRYGTCAAIGPDGRLWISHGFTADGSRFADTVAFDFDSGRWADETPDGDLPVNRCLHACWWTDDGALALYAGQTTGVTALGDRWMLEDDAWRRVTGELPPDRNLYAHARLDDATLVFGGQAQDGSHLADAWLLADGAPDARSLQVDGSPPGRAGATLVRDAGRDRFLLFGGTGADGAFADLWELSGAT